VITVLKPGLLTTVQDAGRPGWRRFGMPLAGAIDQRAYAVANLLAGNPLDAAVLEATLSGPALRFEADGSAAIAGADMKPTLDGTPVEPWSAFPVRAGATLAFGAAALGCRAYLAVRGGIDVPSVLGSRSTYVRAAVGGLNGRPLKAGDAVPVGAAPPAATRLRRIPREFVPRYGGEVQLRALPGPQDDYFTAEGMATLWSATWQVTPRNDRMGYRLDGPRIAHVGSADIVSDALGPGAIQVPGDGKPIVLAVDAQTTGGYPKIAWVIGPDLPALAQARAGARLRFLRCTDDDAVSALQKDGEELDRIAALLDD
jgi:biotin-dependent carboxylase-like uncharacterized protein